MSEPCLKEGLPNLKFPTCKGKAHLDTKLGYNGVISTHRNLCLLSSSDSPASASQGFSMLVRLFLNSGPQVIHPPQPPKVLGLQGLTLLPRLECSGVILVHHSLDLLGSNVGSGYVAQTGLELLGSDLLCQPFVLSELGPLACTPLHLQALALARHFSRMSSPPPHLCLESSFTVQVKYLHSK
ncbi:hypothetical protein AAY473_024766, partial [Plecturocebus cupreus]